MLFTLEIIVNNSNELLTIIRKRICYTKINSIKRGFIMNVFEYAMQMELDGKAYYEEAATKVDSPELKKILLEIAGDEQKHYILFKAMKDGNDVEYIESEATTIFASVKNIFKSLKEENKDFTFPDDAKKIWEKARDVEKKAEAFYREEAEKQENTNNASILHKIADEEHRHWVTMENVINFIDRPNQWLEDGEWHDSDNM